MDTVYSTKQLYDMLETIDMYDALFELDFKEKEAKNKKGS